jgi:tetratricopeptide (TPR) repeat protein
MKLIQAIYMCVFSLFFFGCDKKAEDYEREGRDKFNQQRDYEGAIKDFSKAIELDPSRASAYSSRGLAKYYLLNKEGACADWIKASQKGDVTSLYLLKEHCN